MKKIKFYKLLLFAGLAIGASGCEESFDISFFEKEIKGVKDDFNLGTTPIGTAIYFGGELFEELGDDIEITTVEGDDGDPNTLDDRIAALAFTSSIDASNNENFVTIADQNQITNINILDGKGLPNGTSPITNKFTETRYENKDLLGKGGTKVTDEEIFEVFFQTGNLDFVVSSNYDSDIKMTYKVFSLVKKQGGNVEFFSVDDIDLDETNTSFSRAFDLSEFELDLTYFYNELDKKVYKFNVDDAKYYLVDENTGTLTLSSKTANDFPSFTLGRVNNNIVITTTYELDVKVGDQINNSNRIRFDLGVTGTKVEKVKGDFKQKVIDTRSEDFTFDFFEQISDGEVNFSNTRMEIIVNNGYQFPIGFTLSEIESFLGENAQNKLVLFPNVFDNTNPDTDDHLEPNLDNSVITTANTIGVVDAGLESGGVKTTIKVIGGENGIGNSNLDVIFNDKPDKFKMANIQAFPNPNSSKGNVNVFDPKAELSVDVKATVPLSFQFKNMKYSSDPTEFDGFGDDENEDDDENISEDISESSAVTLIFDIFNTLPLQGEMSVMFLDENDAVLAEVEPVISATNLTDWNTLSTHANEFIIIDDRVGQGAFSSLEPIAFLGGVVDTATGFTSDESYSRATVLITKSVFEAIEKAKNIKYSFVFNSSLGTDGEPLKVNLRNLDRIKIRIFAQGNVGYQETNESIQ